MLDVSGPSFAKKLKATSATKQQGSHKRKHNEDIPPEDQPQKKRKRGGGAWRAFVHLECGGRKFSKPLIQELQRRYRSLSPTSLRRYEQIGHAGRL